MKRWIQLLLCAPVLLVGGVAWVVLDPEHERRMADLGAPAPVVAFLAEVARLAPLVEPAAPAEAGGAGNRWGGRSRGPTLVVTAPVGEAVINNRVTAIGDGEAVRSVIAVPLSSGILTEVLVRTGDAVTEGQVLARLDSEAEAIERDRAELALNMAQDTMERYEQLRRAQALTEVQRKDAENALLNARLALREAENELRRRTITAPISGAVGIVPVETGDYVTPQTAITTIDDRSSILVDFWAPERFADLVKPGQEVQADPIALPGETFQGRIAAIGSRIDRDSRTLQLRAALDNPQDRLRPGMSFRVAMRFPGQRFPAIDPLALQWSSSGPYVWRIDDGKAARIGVRIIQRNSDLVLVDGPLAPGDIVVTEGIQSVRQGAEVRVAGDGGSDGS